MSSNITFSGLASGLDTASIVDKLVSLERAPADALTARKNLSQKRISAISDLVDKVRTLRTAADAADTSSELRGLKATATGSDVSVSGTSSAAPGSWTVKVQQLARAQASRSQVFAGDTAGVAGTGSLSIAVGSGTAVQIDYGPSDSLSDIAAKINGQVPGASASVLDTGSGVRLMINAADTGTAASLSFSETGSGLGMTEVQAAKDAILDVSGTTVTRGKNVLTDVIPGVTMTLTAETAVGGAGSTVTIARDPTAQRAKVQAIVDAHNAIVKVLQSQLSYDGTTKNEGTLFGDSTLQSLQRKLGTLWGSAYNGAVAKDLGLTQGKDGSLTFDTAKFDSVATSSPGKVEALVAGDSGLAKALSSLATSMIAPTTGMLSAKTTGLQSQKKRFDDEIARIEDAADALGERLRKQFTALETAMSSMQSQLSYISKISG